MADDSPKGNETQSSSTPDWPSLQAAILENKVVIQASAPTCDTNCVTNAENFTQSEQVISADTNLSKTTCNQGESSSNNEFSIKIKSRSDRVKLHNRRNEELSSIKKNTSLKSKINFPGKGSHGFKNKVKKGKADSEFTPSIDMMIHDYDDERTLDEEESLVALEDPQIELTSLQKEGDMPLADLMAMYGYQELTEKSDSAEEMNGENPVESNMAKKTEPSELEQLYDDTANDTETNVRSTRYVSRQQSEDEEDIDYSPEEEEKKKTIMVGSDYQAWIPEGLCKYDDALPYENEDKLVWDPCSLTPHDIEDYLIKAQEPLLNNSQGVTAIPRGAHTRDDEQALYLLLQCGYNIEEALRRRRINAVPPNDSMSLWSEEECRNFENGLRCFGKDFRQIHQHKVKTRSVGELVQFYYLWKKTERHDIFANKARLEKKKYSLHPGITDYMDRFLEEQDGPCSRDRSVSPNMQSLVYGESNSHLNNINNSDEKEGMDEYSNEIPKVEKNDKEKKIFNSNDKILLKPKKNDQIHP